MGVDAKRRPVRPARPPAATPAARRPRVDEPAPLGPNTTGAKRHVEDHRPHVCSRSGEDGDLEADLVGVGVVERPARIVDRIGHDRNVPLAPVGLRRAVAKARGRRARMPAPRDRASQRCPRTVPPSRSPGAARPPPSSPGSGACTGPAVPCNGVSTTVAVFQKRMLTSATCADDGAEQRDPDEPPAKPRRRQPARHARANCGRLGSAAPRAEPSSSPANAPPFPSRPSSAR